MPGCNITTGDLDVSKFSQPIPWIGLYIVAGTLGCTIAMAIDTFSSFRNGKFWFPTKFFSLNSSTLTILAVATKFSVDLNTSMPRKQDQLVKLSSSALICTAIANFMPSLGTMQSSDLFSNVLALGIFVITVIVNVGMQMGTGVIYVFLPEHALILSLMLVMLVILCSSALLLIPLKQEIEKEYDSERSKHDFEYDKISRKVPAGAESGSIIAELIKKSVNKLWLSATLYSPQLVVKLTPTCHASGALCLVIPVVLMEASVRALIMDSVSFCGGTCDYKWSSILVLSSQAVAVGVGTIAPASRFFNNVSVFRLEQMDFSNNKSYQLFNWTHAPLIFQPRSKRIRKIATKTRNFILWVFIRLKFQTRVVSMCELLQFASLMPARLLDFRRDRDLEPNIDDIMQRSGLKYIEGCIKRGRMKRPTNLVEFIRDYSTVKDGFKGVHWFNSVMVPSALKPTNCWALPVVTLTTIAIALPYIEQSLIDSLLDVVGEGLTFVRLVDKNLDDAQGSRQTARQTADQVWKEIDLHGRWFEVDLNRLVLEEKSVEQTITELANVYRRCPEEYAAYCMHRVSKPVLEKYDNNFRSEKPEKELFEWLRMTIVDIMGACFTNLPRAFCMERNWHGPLEASEKIIRRSALLLEGAEEILKFVGAPGEDLYEGEQYYIESWRKKKLEHPQSNPSVLTRYESQSHQATCSSNPSVVTPEEISLSIE